MLPICAFEQHRGHHRVTAEFEDVLVEAVDSDVIVQPTYIEFDFAGLFVEAVSQRDWSKIGFSRLASLERDIVRSLQNEAYLIPFTPHETDSLITKCILKQNYIFLLMGEDSEIFHELWTCACEADQSEFKKLLHAWLTKLEEIFSIHNTTIQVLNHYPSTDLLPALNQHLIFAKPPEIDKNGFACDPDILEQFKTGEKLIPVLPALFLEQWRNHKGRQKRHVTTQHLFEIACAFSVILDREATDICRVPGDRRLSAAIKRECVNEIVWSACNQYAHIDGRGPSMNNYVEDTVLRIGSRNLSKIENINSYIDSADTKVTSSRKIKNTGEHFKLEVEHGHLSNLCKIIRLFFELAARSAILESEGRRGLRKGQTLSVAVQPIKDKDALSVIGTAPHGYLKSLGGEEPDLWTQLALDFQIDVSSLFPAIGYLKPQLQAAIAVGDIIKTGRREIADTGERTEKLAIYQLFQTENSEAKLPQSLQLSREKLRKTIRGLGLFDQATLDPSNSPTALPITETDLAKIRKKHEADEKGAE